MAVSNRVPTVLSEYLEWARMRALAKLNMKGVSEKRCIEDALNSLLSDLLNNEDTKEHRYVYAVKFVLRTRMPVLRQDAEELISMFT